MGVRQPAPDLVGDVALVARIAVREEEADRDGVRFQVGQRREVEGDELTLGAETPFDAELFGRIRRDSAARFSEDSEEVASGPERIGSGTSGGGCSAQGR